jgi:hypothetical protein
MEPVEVDAESGAARAGRDEEIADGGKDGDETLQGSRRSKMLQDPFPLSKRDVTVLGPVVQALVRTVLHAGHDLLLCRAAGAELVGDHAPGLRALLLQQAGEKPLGGVLGVNANHHFRSWGDKPRVAGTADEIAREHDPALWQRLSSGAGTKGERLHDWAYCELADLDAAEYNEGQPGLWTRGLLIRRNIADGELAFFSTWCVAGTGIEALVRVEGQRWAIEDSFETAKNELGLDHNESRSWHGWHRHVSLVMLAFAMMAAIRYKANVEPPPKSIRTVTRRPKRL